ncbi:Inherit from bactNOG: membrAne [Seminavis robusta]|uniref:Inherit from bactNOG: membrAne n=1 Tax=Seminavis robusta TaxID=568900 RepID=A0A9N8ESU6_9STRA|nr:Inherit from bactNOG: membrAne [Seminavis robusta]|eukprot:Sro1599_g285000.1 Inherit from bactNOG: membrAne (254) ;mRNA; f:21423-22184
MTESTATEQAAILQGDQHNRGPTSIDGVLTDASSYWPAIVMRGSILFALGLVFVIFPETTVNVISILFGVMVLLEAASSGVQLYAISRYSAPNPMRGAIMMFYFITMMVNIILGVLALAFPDETAQILLILVAVWFVVVGVLQLFMVCLLRASRDLAQSGAAQCSMLLAGALYLTFGTMLLSDLDKGVLTFVRLIGFVVMMFAMQVICFGLFVRALGEAAADAEKEQAQTGTHGDSSAVKNTEESNIVESNIV